MIPVYRETNKQTKGDLDNRVRSFLSKDSLALKASEPLDSSYDSSTMLGCLVFPSTCLFSREMSWDSRTFSDFAAKSK